MSSAGSQTYEDNVRLHPAGRVELIHCVIYILLAWKLVFSPKLKLGRQIPLRFGVIMLWFPLGELTPSAVHYVLVK